MDHHDQCRTTVRSLLRSEQETGPVAIFGTIQAIQEDGPNKNILLFDGSSYEIISTRIPGSIDLGGQLTPWTTIEVKGLWQPDQRHIDAHEVRIMGASDPSANPLNNGIAKHELSHPHLRLKTSWQALLMRFRSETVSAIHFTLSTDPEGPFYQVHHPVITHTDAEGGAEVFPVMTQKTKRADPLQRDDFFGGRRYLTVTAAIHGEAFAIGLDRVWMLAPCFRAERVQDERHLAEFWMFEVAMNFVEDLEVIMRISEEVVRGIVDKLKTSHATEELFNAVGRDETTEVSRAELEHRWSLLMEPDWPRITHAEAVRLMQEAESTNQINFEQKPGPQIDLAAEHELFLTEHFKRPVFVTHYPTKIRLFSALQSPPPSDTAGIQTTESVDLLLPSIGEVYSGGLREHRLDRLIQVMRDKNFFADCDAKRGVVPGGQYPFLKDNESLDSLQWFADLRRWGTSPHGGFGIGFERLLRYLTGARSTKELVAFPRYFGSCEA